MNTVARFAHSNQKPRSMRVELTFTEEHGREEAALYSAYRWMLNEYELGTAQREELETLYALGDMKSLKALAMELDQVGAVAPLDADEYAGY